MYSVSSFAAKKGISVSRVRNLVDGGEIPSKRVGHLVIIPDRAVGWRPRSRRPLSGRMASALLDALTGIPPALSPKEMSRLRAHLVLISSAPHPAEVLDDLLAARGRRMVFSAHLDDLQDLRKDPRLSPSGASLPEFGLSSESKLEAYVVPEEVDSVLKDFMLRPDDTGNIILRAHPVAPEHLLPLAAADLAEAHGGRELREADRVAKGLAERAL